MEKGRTEEAKKILIEIYQSKDWRKERTLIDFETTNIEAPKKNKEENENSKTRSLKLIFTENLFVFLILFSIWFFSGLGYTMFNIFLPQLLSKKGIHSIKNIYKSTFFFSIAGIPGSIIGKKFIFNLFFIFFSLFYFKRCNFG